MNWTTFTLSLLLGVAIDIGIVWLFYWFNGEQYQWSGFWIWQAVLVSASVLLWVRRQLGVALWYVLFGRQLIADEVFRKCVEFQLNPFDKKWDDVQDWLAKHVESKQAEAVFELRGGLTVARQAGLIQFLLALSAYKEAATRYANFLQRRATS